MQESAELALASVTEATDKQPTEKIRVEGLYKIFGSRPERAFSLLKKGVSKEKLFEKTGLTVGLQDINFSVYRGEILVIMGLSGSGKSTLLRCINRLIEPSKGKILLNHDDQSTDITKLNKKSLLELRRHRFGMVFQHFALLPHYSVLQNVRFGLEIQQKPAQEMEEKALTALSQVGLDGWKDAYPHQLSGGMQQRVGLARALAVDPDILLMDEAFSALDPLIRRDMQHELIALQQRLQKTIVFISHDLDEALKIGDRIILMKDGAIVQIGTPEEILTNPANDYVARFVEEVDISKVLTAQSILAKTRAVAFVNDGPHIVLRKMQSESLNSLFVVRRDYTLEGMVTAETVKSALERQEKTISNIIQQDIPKVETTAPLTDLIDILSEWAYPLPVVNENNKLQGVVVKAGILSALSRRPATNTEKV